MTVHTTERALPRSLNYRPRYLNSTIVGPLYDVFDEKVEFSYNTISEGTSIIDTLEPYSETYYYVLNFDLGYDPSGKFLVYQDRTYREIISYDNSTQLLELSTIINTNWPTSINPILSELPKATWEIRDDSVDPDLVEFYYHDEVVVYTRSAAPGSNESGGIWYDYVVSTQQLIFNFWDVSGYSLMPNDRFSLFNGQAYRILDVVSNKLLVNSEELTNNDIDTFFEIDRAGTVLGYGNHVRLTGAYQTEFYLIDENERPTENCPLLEDLDVIHFCNGKSRFYTNKRLNQEYESDYDGEFIEYFRVERFESEYLELYNYNSRTYKLILPHEDPEELSVTIGDGSTIVFKRKKDYTTRYLVTDEKLIEDSFLSDTTHPDFYDFKTLGVKQGDIVRLPLQNLTILREKVQDGRTFIVDKLVIDEDGVYREIKFKPHTMDYIDREWVGNYSVLSLSDREPTFVVNEEIFVNIEDVYLGGAVKVKYRKLKPGTLTEISEIGDISTDQLNPMGKALSLALGNSGDYPVSYYPIESDSELGYASALEALESENVYCLVPMTQSPTVRSMFDAHVDLMNKDYNYRITLLNPELVSEEIVLESRGELKETIIED